MKNEIFIGEDGVTIKYIFRKAQTTSDFLVVSFPGFGGRILGDEWGYIVSVTQFNVNALFIKSDLENNFSYLTYHNGRPVIENTVKALIDQCQEEVNASHIIALGSSMGGFCSLYYGLKYGYDIIAGSPPYTVKDPSKILFAAGKVGKEEEEWFNSQIRTIISEAGKRRFNKKIFISYGEGESGWKEPEQGRKLINDLENAGIKYTYKLYPYSEHDRIHIIFPGIIKTRLGYYLGMWEEPADNEAEFELTPELKAQQGILVNLSSTIENLSKDIKPFTSINEPIHYGDFNLINASRDFEGIEQGLYWGKGYREPVKISDKNDFWTFLPNGDFDEGFAFWFQVTLLNYHDKKNEPKALEWCVENARQYLKYIWHVADPKYNENWWNSLRRMHFFMLLHKLMNDEGRSEDWMDEIPKEILRDIEIFLKPIFSPSDIGLYPRALALLHAAVYFKEDKNFYDSFYNTALETLISLTDYYFDQNGVCVFRQFRDHTLFAEGLMRNISFIDANEFPETKVLRKLKQKFEKIINFAAHMTRPDGILAAIGHSLYEIPFSIRYWITRKTENYILPDSNIAILNDENNFAYITVNGGSNCHSSIRHCDLLSFTFWYDKIQVFTDTGGAFGTGALSEFAVSAMAHNGIIVDDLNYITPGYNDFTTINSVDEHDDFVVLSMSHTCYDGVTLRRRFMWIKPNIIVLYDEAESDSEHKYTQNFVLQNWNVDKNDKSHVIISAAPQFTVSLTQIMTDDNDYDVETFNGTTDVNDEEHFRGSLMSNWVRLCKGLNLAYTKQGVSTEFLTVIEIHGSGEGLSDHEKKVTTAKVEYGKLAVMLEDGTEIIEKDLVHLREMLQKKIETEKTDSQDIN